MSTKRNMAMVAALLAGMVGTVQAQTTRGTEPGSPVVNQISAGQAAALVGGVRGGPGILRIDETAFQAGSGLITFSEQALGTVNPNYPPAAYGGVAADPTVTFQGFFAGQALATPATCPPGAAPTGCVEGVPSAPLSLDAASPAAFIVGDGANPTSPVLSGTPTFNGPIAILFDSDIAGVGLDGGFFDNAGSTAITAFARDGTVLGSVLNEGTAIEFLGLVTADGSDSIAGLLFSLVGTESAGFAIDNVRFGTGDVIIGPGPVAPPEPVPAFGSLALIMLLLGFTVVAVVALRR